MRRNDAAVGDDRIHLPGDRLGHEQGAFPNIDPECCLRHRISGIVHMVADVYKLSCGRKITMNLVSLDSGFGASGQLEFCEQCSAVSGL